MYLVEYDGDRHNLEVVAFSESTKEYIREKVNEANTYKSEEAYLPVKTVRYLKIWVGSYDTEVELKGVLTEKNINQNQEQKFVFFLFRDPFAQFTLNNLAYLFKEIKKSKCSNKCSPKILISCFSKCKNNDIIRSFPFCILTFLEEQNKEIVKIGPNLNREETKLFIGFRQNKLMLAWLEKTTSSTYDLSLKGFISSIYNSTKVTDKESDKILKEFEQKKAKFKLDSEGCKSVFDIIERTIKNQIKQKGTENVTIKLPKIENK